MINSKHAAWHYECGHMIEICGRIVFRKNWYKKFITSRQFEGYLLLLSVACF